MKNFHLLQQCWLSCLCSPQKQQVNFIYYIKFKIFTAFFQYFWSENTLNSSSNLLLASILARFLYQSDERFSSSRQPWSRNSGWTRTGWFPWCGSACWRVEAATCPRSVSISRVTSQGPSRHLQRGEAAPAVSWIPGHQSTPTETEQSRARATAFTSGDPNGHFLS